MCYIFIPYLLSSSVPFHGDLHLMGKKIVSQNAEYLREKA